MLAWGKTSKPYLQNEKLKKLRGMAQVVQNLPSQCEVLSSNPYSTPPPKIQRIFRSNRKHQHSARK
jgi:hypothetical protein